MVSDFMESKPRNACEKSELKLTTEILKDGLGITGAVIHSRNQTYSLDLGE